jgi:hypothetical protein
LFAHASGQWAEKVKGKSVCFGRWSDVDAALGRHLRRTLNPQKIPSPAKSAKPFKPPKPHADRPLYTRACGQCAKRARNRVHHFGPWPDPAAALARWLRKKGDPLVGREPKDGDGLTLGRVARLFLTNKRRLMGSGELISRTRND